MRHAREALSQTRVRKRAGRYEQSAVSETIPGGPGTRASTRRKRMMPPITSDAYPPAR